MLGDVTQSGTKDLAGPSLMFFCTVGSLLTLVLIWGQMPEQLSGEKNRRERITGTKEAPEVGQKCHD